MPIISMLLLFVFSCNESSTSSGSGNFKLNYTDCKILIYVLADIHTLNQSDGTQVNCTEYFGMESQYATGVIDDKERTFEGIYDYEGDTGTIKVVFVNENLIESITWTGTEETANNTSQGTIVAKNIYYGRDPGTYVLDKDDGISFCQNIPTITFNSEGWNQVVTLQSYTCDENSRLWIKFQ